jgi:hypothetical protein
MLPMNYNIGSVRVEWQGEGDNLVQSHSPYIPFAPDNFFDGYPEYFE